MTLFCYFTWKELNAFGNILKVLNIKKYLLNIIIF